MLGASSKRSARSLKRSEASSTPVVGIDLDVAMGEVAGPDPGLAAADPDIEDAEGIPAVYRRDLVRALVHDALVDAVERLR